VVRVVSSAVEALACVVGVLFLAAWAAWERRLLLVVWRTLSTSTSDLKTVTSVHAVPTPMLLVHGVLVGFATSGW
jgi:hypothetical protein